MVGIALLAKDYDSDLDVEESGGQKGLDLAEEILEQRELERLSREMDELGYQKDLENLARAALFRFPELLPGERINLKEVKERLGEIREAGKQVDYKVKPYSKMGAGQAWKYLMQVKAQVRERLSYECPYILEEIDRANEQQKREARRF